MIAAACDATMRARRCYGNIGYIVPGLRSHLGAQRGAGGAIFCFDNISSFRSSPFSFLAGTERKALAHRLVPSCKNHLHPFILPPRSASPRLQSFQPPVALDRLMQFLQNAAAPCALFALGVTVALRPLRRMPWEVPIVLAVKLIIHPVMALLFLSLLGPVSDVWVYTALLMTALPPALNVFIMARQYDTWVEQASSSVLFGTLGSVVTLTSVMWLMKTGRLPVQLFKASLASAMWAA